MTVPLGVQRSLCLRPFERWTRFSIIYFRQVVHTNAVLHIVCVNEAFSIAGSVEECARGAAAGLHGASGLEACQPIGGDSIFIQLGIHQGVSIGVMSREVQEVNTGEDNEESAEQRYCVDGVGCVEPLEKDEGGAEGCGCKGNIVKWVHTVGGTILAFYSHSH